MPIFLGTDYVEGDHETLPFCSPDCTNAYEIMSHVDFDEVWSDDSYEFDETCANCGVLIPASPVAIDQLVWYRAYEPESWRNLAAVIKDDGLPR